jgi:hypothetical protein
MQERRRKHIVSAQDIRVKHAEKPFKAASKQQI